MAEGGGGGPENAHQFDGCNVVRGMLAYKLEQVKYRFQDDMNSHR